LGFGTMNEISSLMTASIISPVVTIDKEGSILIRYEQGNREDLVKALAANQIGLGGRQYQDIVAKLIKEHDEAIYAVIKCMEARKRDFDVKDKELIQMLAGGVRISQSSNSKAEQSRRDDKTKVDPNLFSSVEEKNNNHFDWQGKKPLMKELGQDDRVNLLGSNFDTTTSNNLPPIDRAFFHSKSTTSQMPSRELEPLGQLIRQGDKERSRPNQHSSRLPRPQEQFSSGQDYGSQQVRVVDELTKEDQKFIEEVRRIQIRARQEINSRKTGRLSLGNDSTQSKIPLLKRTAI
jgi:hypothetical protein